MPAYLTAADIRTAFWHGSSHSFLAWTQGLTHNERKQPRSTFIRAGQIAFMLGITQTHNPYKLAPYRAAWERGWKTARRIYYERYGSRKPQQQTSRKRAA